MSELNLCSGALRRRGIIYTDSHARMRLLTFLEYAAIMIGAIGIHAGRYFAFVNGMQLGILLIGAGIRKRGVDSFNRKK